MQLIENSRKGCQQSFALSFDFFPPANAVLKRGGPIVHFGLRICVRISKSILFHMLCWYVSYVTGLTPNDLLAHLATESKFSNRKIFALQKVCVLSLQRIDCRMNCH